MPIYEYHCDACGADFEAIVPFSEADTMKCEKCGSQRVQRMASAFACSVDTTGSSTASLPPCAGGGG